MLARRGFGLLFLGFVLGCGASPADPPDRSRVPETPVPTLSPSRTPAPTPRPSPTMLDPLEYPYATPSPISVEPLEVAGHILSQGRPIAGVRISLINTLNWTTYPLVTDEQGVYRRKVPAGRYFVHYYNDSDNGKIGFWKTLSWNVDDRGGAYLPAFDVYLVGMKNTPGQGASVALPFRFRWTPYPLAKYLRFRVHDRGGPGGKPLFISDKLPADTVSYSYDGTINQSGWNGTRLEPGRMVLWGVYYDAGDSGEGGNLYQDLTPLGVSPATRSETVDLPEATASPGVLRRPARRERRSVSGG